MNLFLCKVNVERFGFDKLHQEFNNMKILFHTAMDACWNNKRKKKDISKDS